MAQQTITTFAFDFTPLQNPLLLADDRTSLLLHKRPSQKCTERGEFIYEILTEALEIGRSLETLVFSLMTPEACEASSEEEKGDSM